MPKMKEPKKEKKIKDKKRKKGVDKVSTPKGNKKKNEKFNFDNEIVIGVNVIPENKDKQKKKKVSKKLQNKKKKNISKNSGNGNRKEEFKRKDYTKLKRGIKIFLVLSLIVGAIVFILTTPLFNVSKVTVVGNEKITSERIESLSNISLNVNTFKYSKLNIIKNIKEEPYVDQVKIKRILPDEIKIEITERKPKYVILYNDSYIYINEMGYILEISNENMELPSITGISTSSDSLIPGDRLEQSDLENMTVLLKINDVLNNNGIESKVTNFDVTDKNDYRVEMNDEGKIVHFGNTANLNDKVLMLKEILVKEKNNQGEVFLQDLNKVFFRQNV